MAKSKAATTEAPEAPQGLVAAAGEINQWGPYGEYTYVTTPYGDYGLKAGWKMRFEHRQVFNKKTQEMETKAFPIREQATKEELDHYGVDLSSHEPTETLVMEETIQRMEIVVDGETFPGIVKQAPVPEDH